MGKIYKAMAKKNIALSKQNNKSFSEAFKLAEKIGRSVVDTGKDFASISLTIKFLLTKEPWLIRYYKLNQTHLNKMYSAFHTDDVIFRSSQFASTIIKCWNEDHAHYQFNKGRTDAIISETRRGSIRSEADNI